MAETSIRLDLQSLMGARGASSEEAEEAALMEGLQQGAEEAYETLIQRYQQPIFNLTYRLVENPGDTKDVVQEVFLKVFRHIGSFRGQSSLKTWIYRIAVNEAHNHRRWFSRHRRHEIAFEHKEDSTGRSYREVLPDPGLSPYEIALGTETRTMIDQELANLKTVFRQAVVLRDVEELSYEEIADILNVTIGTVKSRILRGREALRRKLQERLRQAPSPSWAAHPPQDFEMG